MQALVCLLRHIRGLGKESQKTKKVSGRNGQIVQEAAETSQIAADGNEWGL